MWRTALFTVLFILVLIGLAPATIARSKGRQFSTWWLYGALLFVVALPHSLLLKPDIKSLDNRALAAGAKKCPACAEIVRAEAKVCRYCGADLSNVSAPLPEQVNAVPGGRDVLRSKWTWIAAGAIALIISFMIAMPPTLEQQAQMRCGYSNACKIDFYADILAKRDRENKKLLKQPY